MLFRSYARAIACLIKMSFVRYFIGLHEPFVHKSLMRGMIRTTVDRMNRVSSTKPMSWSACIQDNMIITRVFFTGRDSNPHLFDKCLRLLKHDWLAAHTGFLWFATAEEVSLIVLSTRAFIHASFCSSLRAIRSCSSISTSSMAASRSLPMTPLCCSRSPEAAIQCRCRCTEYGNDEIIDDDDDNRWW